MPIEVNVSRLLSQCCVCIAALVINVNAAEPESPPQVWMRSEERRVGKECCR